MYDIKSIYQAKNVNDAISFLSANDKAIIISGGSDVLIKIREGKLAGAELLSINGLDELKGITIDDAGNIIIGACTCFTAIAENEIINKFIPVLALAVSQVGGPQIRNIGTIGGNICNGVTSADSGATLLALNAKVLIKGKDGERITPLSEFYISAGKVSLNQGDIVTAVMIEKESYDGFTGHYIKYSMRNAMDISTLACAVVAKYNRNTSSVDDVRIAFGTAAPIPIRCYKAEEKIKGQPVGPALLDTITNSVKDEINPRSSWRASKEFRLQIAGEISRRALNQAIVNGGGGSID